MTTCDGCAVLTEALNEARARVTELEGAVARLEAEAVELRAQLAETTKLCELQGADLERFKKASDASRPNHPERAPRDQLQLAFERVLESLGEKPAVNDDGGVDAVEAEPAAQGAAGEGRSKERRGRHRHGRRALDLSGLPVVELKIDPPEVEAAGGVGFKLIGEEVSNRVGRRPAQWFRLRVIRRKYLPIADASATVVTDPNATAPSVLAVAAPETGPGDATEESDRPKVKIVVAPLPAGLWPNVMGDASAIAHVIVSKYDDLVPLNRQESICAREGFSLPKSTQCGWLTQANGFCSPVVDSMMGEAVQRAFIIATDATSAPVLPPRQRPGDPPPQLGPGERPRCHPWHVFVFIADRDHVVFRYDRQNTGAVVAKHLEGYHGRLLADAASVYDVLYREQDMTEHGCWFHARRPFHRALGSDPLRALEALSIIGKLFEVERELRAQDLCLEAFTRLRRERACPILDLLDRWVDANRGAVDPRGPLESAIGYYDNQREALHRFLDDGRIRLDNNPSEAALRKLIVGLGNWVFFANETGIAWYTTFRSLIASCLLHRLNPEIYLEQLLRIVPHWPKRRVLELSPKYWSSTVAKLDTRWRSMLARPWEPGVVLSAALDPVSTTVTPASARVA